MLFAGELIDGIFHFRENNDFFQGGALQQRRNIRYLGLTAYLQLTQPVQACNKQAWVETAELELDSEAYYTYIEASLPSTGCYKARSSFILAIIF